MVPRPVIQPESTDGGDLSYDKSEWEEAWSERVYL